MTEISCPLSSLEGYTSKKVVFKNCPNGSVHAQVAYTEKPGIVPAPVLIHVHGGFLIVGDRYIFLPHWLVNACASKGWTFVSPEYRLLPEQTAHAAVDDAADAYEWVLSSLPSLLGRPTGPVLLAGSSAGAYLALNAAIRATVKPSALLLIYGMLDPAGKRYTTPGTNIFGRLAVETQPILDKFPMNAGPEDRRQVISAHPVSNPATDSRFPLVSALHVDAIFPDYMTGVAGISRDIARRGVDAIPDQHACLFPLSRNLDKLSGLPRTMLLHGINDSAVPVENSRAAEKRLKAAGVQVWTEYPDGAEHGFDARAGNINVEDPAVENVPALEALQSAVRFLTESV